MALLPPLAAGASMTQAFGVQSSWEPHCYHYGTRNAAFYKPNSNYSYVYHYHMGTDWSNGSGTPIYASQSGVVVFAGWAPTPGPYAGGGYVIEVKIAGGAHYISAHCSKFAVKFGANVKRGQIIAYCGQTGTATGPHDHFAVFTLDGYGRRLFYNPQMFMAGGALANSPLILPQTYKLTFAPYTSRRVASIKAGTVVYGYNPTHPGAAVTHFGPSTKNSSFSVNGKTTVTWSPSPGPIPRGTFLHGDPTYGGVFKNLLVVPGAVISADGKAW
jgi:hypothetical protein